MLKLQENEVRPRALLKVTEEPGDPYLALRVSGPLVKSWPEDERVIWRASESTINTLNSELAQSLDELLVELRNAEYCDAKRSEKYFAEYARSAHGYWEDSDADSEEYRRRRQRLSDELAKHAALVGHFAHKDDSLEAAKHAPLIEVMSTRRAPVPFEILPMGQRPQQNQTLLQSCLQLPAFSSVVCHTILQFEMQADQYGRAVLPQSACYTAQNRAFLRSTDTKLWRKMEEYFIHETPRRTLAAAPTKDVLESPLEVAKYLVSPWPMAAAGGMDGNVSDIHVYAHGKKGKGRKNRFYIEFEYPVGTLSSKSFPVRTLDFKDAIENGGLGQERPLIWLNCCEAAGAVGRELFSLSIDLANLGCSVIAPRTAIPEGFATGFAGDFYEFLNHHPVPGVAFVAARLESIRTNSTNNKRTRGRSNPFGVLYFALGNLV